MPVKFDNTLGALFIGFSVSCMVFGIFLSQVYKYIERYPFDRPAYKLLVVGLVILETVDQAFIGQSVYHYTITDFAQPLILLSGSVVWTLIIQLVVGVVVGVIVKTAFALRVWRFSNRNSIVTGVILVSIVAQLGLAIAYTVKAFLRPTFTSIPKLKVLGSLSLAAGVVTDIMTAAALCWYLRSFRTGYASSDSLVNSLTRYAVNTGILTSTFSICTLVLYDVYPEEFLFLAFYFVLSKLYGISFLATLNTRRVVRGRGTDRDNTSGIADVPGNSLFMLSNLTSHRRTQDERHKEHLQIGVHQEVSVTSDGGFQDIEK